MSGFVDTYYGYDLNQPHSRVASFHPFDGNTNQFSLNMIELTVAKPPEATDSRLGYNLTFGSGNAMNVVNSSRPRRPGLCPVPEGGLHFLPRSGGQGPADRLRKVRDAGTARR